MYAPRQVESRLYEELGPPRLHVRLDLVRERWCCFEPRRRLGGARIVPFTLTDSGVILEGSSTVRTMHDFEELVLVLEEDGRYVPLDPNLLIRQLLERDSWRFRNRDIASALLRRVAKGREARDRQFSDDVAMLASENRRRIGRAVDEMGL